MADRETQAPSGATPLRLTCTGAALPGPRRIGLAATEAGPAAPQRLLGRDERGHHTPAARGRSWLRYVVDRDGQRWRLAPGWPLWALLVPFPLWWALGISAFVFPLAAVPMAVELRRRRPLRYPAGWWMWALFLVWTLLSLAMYTHNPSGVHAGSWGGRITSTAVLLADYGSATITMLYVGNLSRTELPIEAVIRWLGTLFIVTVAGGVVGTVAPDVGFTSPFELLLPPGLRSDPYISALVHPRVAQLQTVLGESISGRAAAPFGYTNYWANNLSLLLIWFVCGWWIRAGAGRRVVCALVLAVAAVPIVYSLNRGLWIGLAVSVVVVSVRLFAQGRVTALLAVFVVATAGGVLFMITPLHSIYAERLANPRSNDIRNFLTTEAIRGASESPVLGWGGTRKTIGSNLSIAIGKTPNCQLCGDFAIGSNGQLWTVLFNQGFVGGGLFVGFFVSAIWCYRRDLSAVGQGGVLVVALALLYSVFYIATPAALTITMLSVGLLWRSSGERRSSRHAARPRAVRRSP